VFRGTVRDLVITPILKECKTQIIIKNKKMEKGPEYHDSPPWIDEAAHRARSQKVGSKNRSTRQKV
jgi:hypothetical protein